MSIGDWSETVGYVAAMVALVDDSIKETGIELKELSEPNSRLLRKNMIETGIEVPDYPNAAHHIVAGKSPKAELSREK